MHEYQHTDAARRHVARLRALNPNCHLCGAPASTVMFELYAPIPDVVTGCDRCGWQARRARTAEGDPIDTGPVYLPTILSGTAN